MLLIINNLKLPKLHYVLVFPATPDQNKPVNIMGNVYGKMFRLLYHVLSLAIADLEREQRATTIWNSNDDLLAGSKIVPSAGLMEFQVMGSGDNLYYVICSEGHDTLEDHVSCTCPDHQNRHRECKHIKAVRAYKAEILSLPLEQQVQIISKGNQIATARRNAVLNSYKSC